MVIQYMTNTFINTFILFITVKWYPTFEFDKNSAKTLFSFGWKLVAAQFMNQVYVELKNLFIGKIYTPADLASYNKGEQFPSVLVMNINSAISSVLFSCNVHSKSGKGQIKKINKAIYYDELICCVSNYYRIDNSGGTNDSTSFNR